jgi:cobaltochelatase CobS
MPTEYRRDLGEALQALKYKGTIDQSLTHASRFPVTIPEGTRGIVEEVYSQTALVLFVWKTPKSGKVTAAPVFVSAEQLVNHRGTPPLPGEPMPKASTSTETTTTNGTDEGSTMFQTLTATPPAKAAPAPAPVAGSIDAMLAAIVDARVGARIEALENELATRTGSGAVRVRINDLPERELSGAAHSLLPEALKWAASTRRNGMRYNIALVGDAGTGKSTLAEQVAEALGLRFDYLNCSGGVSESRLFGRMTPNLSDGTEQYTQALLVDYYRNGGVYALDEMDGLDANVLTAANGMFEAKRWTAPNGETVERHPDFLLFGTMNTYGTGASRLYTGRSQLDAASLDRWVILECDYDQDLERSLCSVPAIAERFHAVRTTVRKLGLRRWVTGRMIERAETAHVCHGATVPQAVRAQLAGWTEADLKACGVA